ncbi:Arsenite-transporting ATPase [Desulfurobacterium thermolithotrophum DSM 11699]|uniref:arsenite-transporting ATPase n=1 Tax=Desulfurobacterium thermolithotrophum (strain DSM 11699 / BSA) TaxID=868864 RepID=F0S488_DESTD|nr:ArsA family ATPase [Desulfurobacterium thermolithotrophum]ADY73660.1 Arsenite-transporting ATPase [Desulfurobacterium thermolithotrophum DSM 11699]
MLSKKFFFFSGKGGVGKTTISSSVALSFSEKGFKTLLVSLDPAHSLSFVLEKDVGGKINQVSSNLFAVEIDVEKEMKDYLKRVKKEAEKIVSPVILEEVKAQIDLAFYSPGAFELAILDVIYKIISENEMSYDKIVFDTAPSGYTLRLLSLPLLLDKWLDQIIKLRQEALKYELYSDLKDKRKLTDVYSEDPVLSILKRRKTQFETLRKKLFNLKETLFGIVTNPAVLPIKIAERTVKELEASGIEVKLIVFNRFRGKSLDEVEKAFPKKKVIIISEREKEPVGIKELRKIGKELLFQFM